MFITVIQTTATEFILSRYQARRGSLQFVKGVRHLLTEEENGVAVILASWKGECQGDRIVLALPPQFLSLRELELPLTDRKKGREILPLELKGEMASDADEPVFEALPLTGGKTAAIWCKRQHLAAEIELLAGNGFDPEIATFSLFNWHQLLPERCSAAVAITDGEAVAVYLDGKPLFFRVLPKVGERPLDATITALELLKNIHVETVFTLGQATINTGLTTVPLTPGSAVSTAFAGDVTAAADLAAQFAMAQELVAGEPVNLRRGALSFTKTRDQFRNKLRFTLALLIILLILIFAEAGVRYVLAKRDVASLDSSIRTIYREVFPTRTKPVDEVAELKAEIKKLGGSSSEGLLAVLKKLTEAKGDSTREIYELDFDGNQISGKGYDRSTQEVNDFKTKAAPLFTGFEVSEIKSRPDGSVGFSFHGTLKGGGK
jgi:general secretion pathway protein L